MTSDNPRLVWRKSSRSTQQGECVELARTTTSVRVRDSKDADGPALVFSPVEARALAVRIKGGEFGL
ncbi:DUF397 domain-containing protein [Actinomadura oligospora]|uniref:DUF397 domain-containing protein n=1 Tax=Actinomadura oligospora TaxID=111804 RepID=UPI0004789E13|nr:DUF397 domain-containing protein [Actinomadura oligospora]